MRFGALFEFSPPQKVGTEGRDWQGLVAGAWWGEEGWPAKFGVRGWAGWLATACNGVLITIRVVIE